MVKIDFPDGLIPSLNPAAYTKIHADSKRTKDKSSVKDTQKPRFAKILETTTQELQDESAAPIQESLAGSEERLQELLDDVHSCGDDLKSRPFPEEIKRYKQAVRNFLHYIVDNGYTVAEHTSGTNLLKRKKFTMVQVVDRKLEQLAAGILSGQVAQIELLARIDEITGLLVDLLQ